MVRREIRRQAVQSRGNKGGRPLPPHPWPLGCGRMSEGIDCGLLHQRDRPANVCSVAPACRFGKENGPLPEWVLRGSSWEGAADADCAILLRGLRPTPRERKAQMIDPAGTAEACTAEALAIGPTRSISPRRQRCRMRSSNKDRETMQASVDRPSARSLPRPLRQWPPQPIPAPAAAVERKPCGPLP